MQTFDFAGLICQNYLRNWRKKASSETSYYQIDNILIDRAHLIILQNHPRKHVKAHLLSIIGQAAS